MADLIDRQAVMKEIEKIRQGALMMDDTRRAGVIMNGMQFCEEAVMNQPSAQPEIIRCKDCEHWRERKYLKTTKRYVHFCRFNAIYTEADDYCSKAERRTDE